MLSYSGSDSAPTGMRTAVHRCGLNCGLDFDAESTKSSLKGMAGTTRLELATSAVTGSVVVVTSCNFTAPIATLGALRNPQEVLLHPYCTQIFGINSSPSKIISAESRHFIQLRTNDPFGVAEDAEVGHNLRSFRWQPHCRSLYQTPMAA